MSLALGRLGEKVMHPNFVRHHDIVQYLLGKVMKLVALHCSFFKLNCNPFGNSWNSLREESRAIFSSSQVCPFNLASQDKETEPLCFSGRSCSARSLLQKPQRLQRTDFVQTNKLEVLYT